MNQVSRKKNRPWWANTRIQLLSLVILTLLMYGRTVQYNYTLDDAIVITQNDFTRKGIKGIPDILAYDTFRGFFKKEGKDKLVAGGRYRPLSLVLYAVVIEVFGDNPAVFHLLNILLYTLLVTMVYWFLLALLGPRARDSGAAWLGALIFAWHPLHVEVVANIKGGDEVLALLFTLATVYIVVFRECSKNTLACHFIPALFAFLAMMSKENAIVLLAWAPLLLWLQRPVSIPEVLRRSIGVLTGVSAYLMLRFLILGAGNSGGTSGELMNNPFLKVVDGKYLSYTWTEKMASIFYTLWEYFRLMFFPHPLTHDYYPRSIPITGWGDVHVLLGILVSVVLFLALFLGIIKRRKWAIIPAIYILPLLIVANIFFPIGTHMGERFVFFSSLALSVAAGMLLLAAGMKWRVFVRVFLAVVLLGFGVKTWSRIPAWKDDFTLFTTDVHLSPNSAKARNAAAGALVDAAYKLDDESQQTKYYQQAVRHEKIATRIHPNYDNAHYIMGLAQMGMEDYQGAIRSLTRAIQLSPGRKGFEDALFLAYLEAGKYKGEKENNPEAAIRYLKEAEKLKKNDPELYRLLGVAHGVLKHYPDAIRYFKKALKFKPGNKDLYNNLSMTFHFMGVQDSSRWYAAMAEKASQLSKTD